MKAGLEIVKAQKNPPLSAIAITMTLVTVSVYYDSGLALIGSALGLLVLSALLRLSPKALLLIFTVALLSFQYQSWRLSRLNPELLAQAAKANKLARLCVKPCVSKLKGNAFPATIIKAYFPEIEERSSTILVKLPFPGEEAKNAIDADKTYLLEGRLESPQEADFPFQFNSMLWLKRQQIFVILKASKIEELESTPATLSYACANLSERIRKAILTLHQQILGQDNGALLTSMVIGEKAVALPESLKSNFRTAGLSHLLAASGLNLSILALTVGYLCRKCQITGDGQRKISNTELCLSISLILTFTFLAGLSPSVLRATLMSLIAILAKWRFMTLSTGASLALALMASLLYDPFSVLDLGFALSYLATSGLIYIYPLLEACLTPPGNKLHQLWQSLVLKPALMVIASTSTCLPIQLLCFPDANIYVIFSNVAAEPLVVPITIIGFLSSFGAACNYMKAYSPLGYLLPSEWLLALILFLDKGIQFLLSLLNQIATCASHLPGAHCEFGKPVPLLLAGYYFLMLSVVAVTSRREIINQLRSNANIQATLCLLLLFLFLLAYTKTIAPTLEVYANKQSIYLRDGQSKLIRLKLSTTPPASGSSTTAHDKIKDSVEWAFRERYRHLKLEELGLTETTSLNLEESPFTVEVKKLSPLKLTATATPTVPLFYRFLQNMSSETFPRAQSTSDKFAPKNSLRTSLRNSLREERLPSSKRQNQQWEFSLYPNKHHIWYWLPWQVHAIEARPSTNARFSQVKQHYFYVSLGP